ncbi:MAG: ABC transporter permease [Synergistales bacterium]|nr:ABC transporter permease [Synergistales bacterium]
MPNAQRRFRIDKVALSAVALGILSLLSLPVLTVRASRLSAGEPLFLREVAGLPSIMLLCAGWGILLLHVNHRHHSRGWSRRAQLAAVLMVLGTLLLLGEWASSLIPPDRPYTRVSIASGGWLQLAAGVVFVFSACTRLGNDRACLFLKGMLAAGVVLLFLSGAMEGLSIMRELANKEARFLAELRRHLALVGGAVSAGTTVGVPLGILVQRRPRFRRVVLPAVHLVQTVPSLALFGLFMTPLALAAAAWPLLRSLNVGGIGWAPAFLALALYSLLPIVRNTYAAFDSVPPFLKQAGRGMGMNVVQLFGRVEVPLALPVVLAGVRTSAVQAVGNTAVAALIGAGGLGSFIFQGLGEAAPDLILLGALPIILLAVLVDRGMQLATRLVSPRVRPGGE